MSDDNKILPEPRVGIWWYWKGKVYDFSVPLSKAEEVEGFSNGPIGHYEAWPEMQRTVSGLEDLDYPDIPRGCVVRIKDKGVIFYSSTTFLNNSKKIAAVLSRFCLDRRTIMLRPDEHYEKTIHRKDLLF